MRKTYGKQPPELAASDPVSVIASAGNSPLQQTASASSAPLPEPDDQEDNDADYTCQNTDGPLIQNRVQERLLCRRCTAVDCQDSHHIDYPPFKRVTAAEESHPPGTQGFNDIQWAERFASVPAASLVSSQ